LTRFAVCSPSKNSISLRSIQILISALSSKFQFLKTFFHEIAGLIFFQISLIKFGLLYGLSDLLTYKCYVYLGLLDFVSVDRLSVQFDRLHKELPLYLQCVPLATEPGISLIILPLMRVSQQLGALQTHTTDTFLFISHTTNVILFKFRCSNFIGVRIIKEMPVSVASGTLCIIPCVSFIHFHSF